jgi:hypothetical protein
MKGIDKILHFLLPDPPDLLLDGTAAIIAIERSGERMSFPCRHHYTMVLHAHASPGVCTIGPFVAAVQRRSFTAST